MTTSILSRRLSGIDFAARVHFRLVFFFFNYMCIIMNSFMVVIFTFTFVKLSRL